jgi:hypothetical protein
MFHLNFFKCNLFYLLRVIYYYMAYVVNITGHLVDRYVPQFDKYCCKESNNKILFFPNAMIS